MPSGQLPRLFRNRAGLTGGSGLGLAVSKGLVEAHGCRIRAESGEPGLGARLTFTLPAACAECRGAGCRPRCPPGFEAGKAAPAGSGGLLPVPETTSGRAGMTLLFHPLHKGSPLEGGPPWQAH